jgi:hypothetical protein
LAPSASRDERVYLSTVGHRQPCTPRRRRLPRPPAVSRLGWKLPFSSDETAKGSLPSEKIYCLPAENLLSCDRGRRWRQGYGTNPNLTWEAMFREGRRACAPISEGNSDLVGLPDRRSSCVKTSSGSQSRGGCLAPSRRRWQRSQPESLPEGAIEAPASGQAPEGCPPQVPVAAQDSRELGLGIPGPQRPAVPFTWPTSSAVVLVPADLAQRLKAPSASREFCKQPSKCPELDSNQRPIP